MIHIIGCIFAFKNHIIGYILCIKNHIIGCKGSDLFWIMQIFLCFLFNLHLVIEAIDICHSIFWLYDIILNYVP